MSEDEIAWMPATEMAARIAARAISPSEIVDALLTRIERLEPRVNAFAWLDPVHARAQARAAEVAVGRGEALGPLHGVPVTIKDLIWTHDMPTQFGSVAMEGYRPPIDAPSVARVRAAGGVVFGKTTTSEFGWTGVSRSPLTGITHNPWRHGINAGASSAGAGAAAAAGFGPLHQGTDGAGSIRMPAHFCGVYGLKPTYGRVPFHPVGLGDYTSVIGPLTRTVADAALLLGVMAGQSPLDHTSLDAPPADYAAAAADGARGDLRGLRIAYSPDLGHARVDPDIAAMTEATARRLQELGATVDHVATPWAAEGPELVRALWPANLARQAPRLAAWEARMDPGFVACIRAGEATTMAEYQMLRERKYAYVAALNLWFEEWDLLLTPAVSVAGFPADRLVPAGWPEHAWDWVVWAEFSYPFNLAGNPAAAIPAGLSAGGLPGAIQLVGRRGDDAGVIRASAALEGAAPWALARPTLVP